jgi:threonine aldolase
LSPSADVIDLRSDTVTRPTPGMRRALAEAEVGDDVFDDDPTLHALQQRVAELTGKAAALYVVSGTQGNQLAIRSQVRHGEEILLERECHIFNYEAGAAAALTGAQLHPLIGNAGALAPEDVAAAVRGPDYHHPPSRLLCLENTHNRAGGRVIPLESLEAAACVARDHGLSVHLDGARLWNASVATGIPIARWAAVADTLMMCFSKGLGAPVGSILVGDSETIARARRYRKMFGGGIRQGGILAAACLYALDHHIDRLAEDHRRARRLAELAADAPGLSADPGAVETNIVLIGLTEPAWPAERAVQALADRGLRVVPFGPRTLRAVTHLDVNDAAIERAGDLLRGLCEASAARH